MNNLIKIRNYLKKSGIIVAYFENFINFISIIKFLLQIEISLLFKKIIYTYTYFQQDCNLEIL